MLLFRNRNNLNQAIRNPRIFFRLEYYRFPIILYISFLFHNCEFHSWIKLLWIFTISEIYGGIFSIDKNSIFCKDIWRIWISSSNGDFYIYWFDSILRILCCVRHIFQHSMLYLAIGCWRGPVRGEGTYFQ